MKKIFLNRISFLLSLIVAATFFISSCKEDSDGSQYYAPGTPAFESVTPAEASGGTVITLAGTGLGDIRSIVLENHGVPVPFMSTLNTDTHILFTIPDTAYGGNQNIVLTNGAGKTLSVPFKVIALPIITTAFPTDFQAGSTISITGNNLDDVTNVIIEGTTDEATIVTKTRKSMVLQMPSSTVNKGKLKITNLSGFNISSQEFVNIDKALPVFTDAAMNGFDPSWSWGGTFTPSTEDFITGTASLKAAYDPTGTWGGMQFGNNGSVDISEYRYFTFWVKGADVDKNVQFWLNWQGQQVITVPANTWTYFKYDLITNWAGLTSVNNVTFQMQNEGKTLYFDNIVFIK